MDNQVTDQDEKMTDQDADEDKTNNNQEDNTNIASIIDQDTDHVRIQGNDEDAQVNILKLSKTSKSNREIQKECLNLQYHYLNYTK